MSELDESLRERLRQAADEEAASGHLDISELMAREGPRYVRQGVVRQRVRAAGAVGLGACAAAALVFLFVRGPGEGELPAASVASACSAREPSLSLGPLPSSGSAVAAFDVDGVAEVVEADPCRSVVALREGRIAVHARDLGGGELVVRTARADVRVIGTIFEVDVQRSLEVRVSEGIVAVNVTDGPRVRLERNERFSLEDGVQPWDGAPFETAVRAWSEGGPVAEPAAPNEGAAGDGPQSDLDGELGPDGREPTDDSEAVPSDSAPSVHAELGEPSTEQASERASPSQPRLSVDELFTAAESARRNGDLAEARRFYRLAGQRRGTTAESAWIRLARLELQAGSPSAALRALQRRRGSVFVAEASWLKVQALEAAGRLAEARRVADRLVRRRGSTPQGRAAAAWLDSH